MTLYKRNRNIVPRPDGKLVNVARPRGQLFVCATGCCCGREEDGFPPVPTDLFHKEWDARRLRYNVHLTVGGCLGPCALSNVVMLLFDGETQWFQSMHSEDLIIALYDHIETMLEADQVLQPTGALAEMHFTATRWQDRPDGHPVDDVRPWKRRPRKTEPDFCKTDAQDAISEVERLIVNMPGASALPRKNGELVFDEPWQGRIFGLAVSLHQSGVYTWDEFRDELVAGIAVAEQQDEPFKYYDVWLAAFERVLEQKGVITGDEVDETTYQFEFGERDEVY